VVRGAWCVVRGAWCVVRGVPTVGVEQGAQGTRPMTQVVFLLLLHRGHRIHLPAWTRARACTRARGFDAPPRTAPAKSGLGPAPNPNPASAPTSAPLRFQSGGCRV